MGNNKKSIIAIIIVMIAVIGIFSYIQYQNYNATIELGKTTFKLPESFEETGWTDNNTVQISNGKETAYISLRENNNLNDAVNSFAKGFDENGRPTTITNFTVDNVFVYKLNIENDSACYYWFKNNGETYSIYKWDSSNNIETVVIDLIRSIETD